MNSLLIVIFVVTYAAIALEHPIKINKSASALLGAGLMWALYAVMSTDAHAVNHELAETLVSTAQIVFFLMGAMTIVEVVDAHKGFDVVTSRIKTTQLSSLLWLVSGVTFFLSAILDNLTTTIVMVSLLKKLLDKREDRLLFAGLIVIAANSGGAWSPIGDVTTTMLWIGGQITAGSIIQSLFVPSLVGLGLLWMVGDVLHKGKTMEERSHLELSHALSRIDMSSIVFFIGILLAVATLEHTHILTGLAQWLDSAVGRQDVIVMLIGVFSAIVDNVPLVAASMGMYSLQVHPADSFLWTFLAYCAGTGGSILIIGSAAGVAAMGIEKIDFVWYFKKISALALAGYLAGAAVYILQVGVSA